MKIDEIKAIVKLMAEYDLTEFKVEAEECNLCICRSAGAARSSAPEEVLLPPVRPAQESSPAPAVQEKNVAEPEGFPVTSPLVGTFYRAAKQGGAPLVQVGDKVAPDTVIGIIEAMKVMNEIKAEKSGVVTAILVENEQVVEYGQPLLILG